MVKTEFIDSVCAKVGEGVSKKDVEAVYAAIFEVLGEVIAKEDSVRTPIGTFLGYTRETGERKARNPQTGAEIVVPAKKVKGYPKFRPAKALKG